MKIVCQSCGAKYSIADEKVAGKVFKIRCKKCSATIVVKGEQQDAEAGSAAPGNDAEAIWHAVVAGEQQGPFSPRQIGEMLAEGKIDWEVYVWREGMENWLPAKDVEDLVKAVMSDGAEATEAQPDPASVNAVPVFGGSSDMGADPFAGDDGGLAGMMTQPAVSAVAVPSGTDLFGQSSRSPFAGAADEEEAAAAAARAATGEALTGQRNENSVLFSLSNLQALATGSGTGAAATSARPGMAAGEGSGLIDIRALATATQAVAEKPNGSAREKVEDLMAVGAGGTTFSAAAFAAPVAAEKPDNSKAMMGVMGAAILVLGGAVAYLAMREPAPQAVIAAPPSAPLATEATGAVGSMQPSAGTSAQAAVAPTPAAEAPSEPAAEEPSREEKNTKSQATDTSDKLESGRSDRKPKTSSGSSSTKSSEKPEVTSAPEPAAPPPKKPTASSSDSSIDDLLSGALGGKAAAKPSAKPAESLAATPSRDDVLTAMKSVTAKVQTCANGTTGVAQAKVIVAGPTGRITSVDVTGAGAGGPAAACISKEVGKAKFPKFSQPTFSFTFPFKL
jgi:predicted Zn finger-like uncharacterized protein